MINSDRLLGCLLCGALGDAFCAPFEGMEPGEASSSQDMNIYLQNPCHEFTDDTQMTLFTLEALHIEPTSDAVYRAYLRWFDTQYGPGAVTDEAVLSEGHLHEIPEIWSLRQPGHTCIDSLRSGVRGTIAKPISNSLGNGTVMRSAPFGFTDHLPDEDISNLSSNCAAITHGDPDAWISAGIFSVLIHNLLQEKSIYRAFLDTQTFLDKNKLPNSNRSYHCFFQGFDYLYHDAAHQQILDNLGEGWTGPEALGLGLLFAGSYKDLESMLIAIANHGGDTDTIASIAGNIWGAAHGALSISMDIRLLQLIDVIREMAYPY